MIGVTHPLLSLPGPAGMTVTRQLSAGEMVPLTDPLTSAAVLSNFMPRIDIGTIQGVGLVSGMEAKGFVARLEAGTLGALAATAESAMLDAARIARDNGLTPAKLRMRFRKRRMPRFQIAAEGWKLGVINFLQCTYLDSGARQELGYSILTSMCGPSLSFGISLPYAGEYVLGAGFRAPNAGCNISIELDKKEGRAWTGGYYFHLDETAIASCKEAAGWGKNTSPSEMMTRLRDEILDSGQYKGYEIPSGFQFGSRRGVAYMTSEDRNIRSQSSDPFIYMSDSDRRGRVTERPSLNVALRQPLEQIRTTGCSFWPLTAGLKDLLWDPVMKTAAPRIYEETTKSQQG